MSEFLILCVFYLLDPHFISKIKDRIGLFTLHPIHLLFVHSGRIYSLCCKLYFYINLGFNSLLSKVTQTKLTAMSDL